MLQARKVFPVVLVLLQLWLVMLWAWPNGHWTVDSLVQLYEGRFTHFVSFNPLLMSWLLGFMDRMGIAAWGYLCLSSTMLAIATRWDWGWGPDSYWAGVLAWPWP